MLETLDEEAGERMMERLKQFRVEGKLSNRARNELSKSIIIHNSLNVVIARDDTAKSYQWLHSEQKSTKEN